MPNGPKAIRITGQQDLSAGALSLSYTMTKDGYFHNAGIGFSVGCSQTVTFTITAVDGAAYTWLEDTTVLSNATAYKFRPNVPIFLKKGDKVTIGITTGGAAVASAAATFSEHTSINA